MIHKIKALLQWIILIIAFVLGFSLIRGIFKIVGSGGKITQAGQQVDELTRQNEGLKGQLANVSSVQFVEEQARDKLGLAKKGEMVVVLPDSTTLRMLAPKETEAEKKLPDPIWRKWVKLFE